MGNPYGHRVHGLRYTAAYRSWSAMKIRCLNPNDSCYHRYGGRGIGICEQWYSFAQFYADMGERPAGMTLERINNDGNYEPDNCKWATQKEQARNTVQNRVLIFHGKRLCLSDAAKLVGIKRETLARRLNAGWSCADALDKPVSTAQDWRAKRKAAQC